ncbi:MAG: formyltetrahydrofolate deformylase [Alteromonadaceae bacterium]|uniref:formyltetrahydrofolate deformylase n=1 Tax=uncultured Paraglaciecola sp. TaxID=1765024 RepID=UPI000C5BC0FE|nr:formyltetrahydrofolate deformylase [Alteromonadaceae bacterium]
MSRFILTVDCPETLGIVRKISDFIFQLNCTVLEAAEYADVEGKKFYGRWDFSIVAGHSALSLEDVEAAFEQIGEEYGMSWTIYDCAVKPKILLAVSQHGHCLNDLLYRWKEEESFPGEVVGVVSNHEVFRSKVEWYGLPFYYLPITPETKPQQENQILDVMSTLGADLLVLARYMQILSDDMCQKVAGHAINIHHSFLPSFKGARPYHQARERGVKLSGATAHYVTSDLDEGPIIEQNVQRVNHAMSGAKMARIGKNIENLVLAKAVYLHCQHRIIIDGNRTIIFE